MFCFCFDSMSMTEKPKHWLGKLKADTCLCYTTFFFLLAVDILAITAISIGFTYQGQCPINQNIAIFLIVGGILFAIYSTSLLVIVSRFVCDKSHRHLFSFSYSYTSLFDRLRVMWHKYPRENVIYFQ